MLIQHNLVFPLLSLAALAARLPSPSVETLFSLPSPPDVSWLENLAYRPSTDTILATRLDIPQLWSISARTGAGTLLANVTDTTALVGITQTRAAPPFDEFYIAGVNFSAAGVQPNSSALWRLAFAPSSSTPTSNDSSSGSKDFTLEPALVLPGVGLINGLATWDEHTLLAADSHLGAIWAVDLGANASAVALRDPATMTPLTAGGNGVNGVKVLRGGAAATNSSSSSSSSSSAAYVYYTSTDRGLVARIPVDHLVTATSAPEPEVEVLARGIGEVDDFALLADGGVVVATGPNNTVVRVGLDGAVETVAGGADLLVLASATACQFGTGGTLYVTTAGGAEGPVDGHVAPGSVVAVEMGDGWA